MTIQKEGYIRGRLSAKPSAISKKKFPVGIYPLNTGSKRDVLFYIPESYNGDTAAAIAVMLHGSGGQAEHGLALLRGYADDQNMILMAPPSEAHTWDVIQNDRFGPDVKSIDKALTFAFGEFFIDPTHVAVGGFSDGASYALCLGLSNGDLFTHIIAFSPGFFYNIESHGKPQIFISHGVQDAILPIDPCSRHIVPELRLQGFAVQYHEFDGGHDIPPHISNEAIGWFVK